MLTKGLPGGSDGKESACNAGDLGLTPVQEDPLEKGMATYFSILAWRIRGQREELDTTERLTFFTGIPEAEALETQPVSGKLAATGACQRLPDFLISSEKVEIWNFT